MKKIHTFLAVLIMFSLAACKNESEKKTSEPAKELSIVEKIARANGLDNFDNLNELHFTFNVKVNDSLRTSRQWIWKTKTNEVTLTTKDSTVTYNHKTEAEDHKWVDQRFINDQYWLLFPFHLVWDDMDYKYTETATAPVSGETMQKVTITYPPTAGYTPGDMYEVYFGGEYMIREWVYMSGGNTENPFAATWENYKDFNGIKIATRHKNKDGSFELYFDGIEVVTE